MTLQPSRITMTSSTSTAWNVTDSKSPIDLSTTIPANVTDLTSADGMDITAPAPFFDMSYDSRDPVIVKSATMLAVAVVNLVGNGIALTVIRRTSKLRTHTFVLLASLTTADLLTGVTLIVIVAYQLPVYVFNGGQCYVLLVAVLTAPTRYPVYVSTTHAVVISAERFIAVVYPLQYATWVTDTTIKGFAAFAWIIPAILTSPYWLFISRIDRATCSITGAVHQSAVTDTTCLLVDIIIVIILYWRILTIALKQRAKINAEMAEVKTAPGERAAAAGKKMRGEMKAVKLTACVVGAVVVLWTPYAIGGLMLVSDDHTLVSQFIADVGLVLGIINSCINWIIYGAASKDFRKAVVQMFRGTATKSPRVEQSAGATAVVEL